MSCVVCACRVSCEHQVVISSRRYDIAQVLRLHVLIDDDDDADDRFATPISAALVDEVVAELTAQFPKAKVVGCAADVTSGACVCASPPPVVVGVPDRPFSWPQRIPYAPWPPSGSSTWAGSTFGSTTRTTRHDTTRHDTTRHDTTRHDTTRHDTTRHDTTRHDTTRHTLRLIVWKPPQLDSGVTQTDKTPVHKTPESVLRAGALLVALHWLGV